MADPEEADVVIQMMHGRFFGQRKLTADHWDGKTKYKCVTTALIFQNLNRCYFEIFVVFRIIESEAEVQKRLNNWDQYLTQEENERKENASKPGDATEEGDLLCANEDVKDIQSDVLEEDSKTACSDDKAADND